MYRWTVGTLGRDGFWDAELWEVLLIMSHIKEVEFEDFKIRATFARMVSYWSGVDKIKNPPRSYEDFMPFDWEREKKTPLTVEERRKMAEIFDKQMKKRYEGK